jgi:hypothetical protein
MRGELLDDAIDLANLAVGFIRLIEEVEHSMASRFGEFEPSTELVDFERRLTSLLKRYDDRTNSCRPDPTGIWPNLNF